MIVPAQTKNLQVKPRWVAPVGIMESVVAYNCRKYGMPRPVLAMPMWEGAGNQAIDLSGHGNHGSLVSSPGWSNVGGTGVLCNGDYKSINIDTPSLTKGTIVIRGRVVGDSPTYRYVIMGNTTSELYFIQFQGTDVWRLNISASYTDSSAYAINIGETYTFTIQLPSRKVWINNDKIIDTTHVPSTITKFNIGANPASTERYANMNILNSFIFNEYLTEAQIKFLHDNPYFMYRLPEELYGYAAAAVGDTVTYTSDALFKKLGLTKTYTSDALLKKQAISITYSADALLKIQNLLKSYTSDLLIKLTDGDVTYSADVLLELDGITKAYSSDLLIAVRNTKAYTTDALLKALGVSTSYTADALLKLIDESKTYTADSLIKKVDAGIPYTSDALLKKEDVSVSYTTDLLIQEIDNILSYTADLIIQLVATRTYTADALLKKLDNVASYTADVIINAAGVGVVSYSADALFKLNNITKAYTADLLIMVTNTLSYTADALIKKTDASVNYSSDALFKGLGLTKTYTADSLLQKINLTVGYSSDALLQKAFTAAYTSDTILKKEGATTLYTADALLKKAVSLSYSVDVIISSLVVGSRTYTADLLIDIVSAEYPARVFFIRKSGTPQTGLTPAIDCYNKVVDGSSGGTSPMVREIGCGHYKFHYDIAEDIAVRVDTGDVTMTDEERYLDVGVISQYDGAHEKISDIETLLKQHDAKITGLLM